MIEALQTGVIYGLIGAGAAIGFIMIAGVFMTVLYVLEYISDLAKGKARDDYERY